VCSKITASRACTDALLGSGTTAIAYETVRLPDRSLPLLAPMSEVAGRLAPQVGAYHLVRPEGGRGVLMGGVPGVPGADVVIIGGGVAGQNAAAIALGTGAEVILLDVSIPRLREIDAHFDGRVSNELVSRMRPGSVLVDIAVDQGGCFEDSRPTTHDDPTYRVHDTVFYCVAFYCVANMPGAVPHTSHEVGQAHDIEVMDVAAVLS
jgi:alanine dehydrogenase